MKPEAWAALKALQRANKRARPITSNGGDARRAVLGVRTVFGTDVRSRKPMRKAREKAT